MTDSAISQTPDLNFVDGASRNDLLIFLQRLETAGLPETRLVTRNTTLAVFGSTQAPSGLLDNTDLVLVHRAFELAEQPAKDIDVLVQTRALLDRLNRPEAISPGLPLPPVHVTAAWAGVLPPTQGWLADGKVDARSLAEVARMGAERVASALPEQPGQALVDRARKNVWSATVAPGVPAAAAFALESLGLLSDQQEVRLLRSRNWVRLSTGHGDVFVRSLVNKPT